ncbi:methyltransferase domain-containing protein [Niabella hirudinis]|uniref:class I SAM-dependent methyltransferase n=1 Tax=Niabella hirudinis TaxID=1285929 RepID=UPI003EB7E615
MKQYNKELVYKEFRPVFPWFPNVDGFIPRTNILEHITHAMGAFSGILLDVGCGYMPYRRYIEASAAIDRYVGMDLEDATTYKSIKPDITWDGYTIPLPDNSVHSVLLTEVLEHCPYPEKVLSEIHRVLRPGGKVVFTVPFVWYLHEAPFDFYRYTPYAIHKMMKGGHLSVEELYAYGVNTQALMHAYAIWLKRSSWPKAIRFLLYLFSLPLIMLAWYSGKNKKIRDFKNNQMFSGLCGIAFKQE